MAAGRALGGLMRAGLVALPLALAACGGSTPPPSFPPLSYTYLQPLRINVASIDVVNDFAPGADDISGQSPQTPVAALRQMAHDRLIPAGASGRAIFTIERAAIRQNGDSLSGDFRVKLDIYTSDGQRAAFAEAAVAHTAQAPDDQTRAGMRAALYGFTRTMMSDMNVELEYQLRRSVGDWVEAGPATAPPPPSVTAQPLPAPSASNPSSPATPSSPSSPTIPANPGTVPATPGYRLVPSPPPPAP